MAKLTNASKLVISILLSFAAGAIGSLATITNIPTWYAGLTKPAFNPPNWVFGPVWSTLYLLMGISLYLVWTTKYKGSKRSAYGWFGVQLALNALWSLVFFGLHWFWGGVIVILILLAAIVMTGIKFYPISKTAASLLTPYLLWVSFATILTFSLTQAN